LTGDRSIPLLDLLDWKRAIFDLYREIRATPDHAGAWQRWRVVRDELFAGHAQSPIPEAERDTFRGLSYFEYDPSYRAAAEVRPAEPMRFDIPASGEGEPVGFTRFAVAVFELHGSEKALELYWLDGYGGGMFLSFRDSTSGVATYGAARYLLDTVKGADLGMEHGRLVLDFNFAYNPSCAYDPRWVCPLATPPNRLAIPIEAGERAPPATQGAHPRG
jgi:uncharacterized protein (DUF1684 family)